jgi:hybrid cluster-associated redox disulfide protein
MAEINADSTIYELLQAKPESTEALFKFGMGCVGCAIARGETIRQAAEAHGIPLPSGSARSKEQSIHSFFCFALISASEADGNFFR